MAKKRRRLGIKRMGAFVYGSHGNASHCRIENVLDELPRLGILFQGLSFLVRIDGSYRDLP